ALVALTEVTKQVEHENPDFFPIKPMDYGIYLVISLGTGLPKAEEKYNADMAAKWGDDTLGVTESSTDIATKENLENLVKVGEKLLKKPVSRVNLQTGLTEPVTNGGTNGETLIK
ncbi:hypothetical protein FRX31_012850, partial [Thalictrum thalictroides]